MNEEQFNLELRKLLKRFGVGAQREIEQAAQQRQAQGGTLHVRAALEIEGMGEVLVEDVKDKVQRIPTVSSANVELTFDPPWNQSMMSEAARLQTGMF